MTESFEERIDYKIKSQKNIRDSQRAENQSPRLKPNMRKQNVMIVLFILSIMIILAIALFQTRQVSTLSTENERLKATVEAIPTITNLQETVTRLETENESLKATVEAIPTITNLQETVTRLETENESLKATIEAISTEQPPSD